ncbi:MAG: ABC transporter permease [Bdellovibrionales bacterium]|nr:ABC transporter permease [Bdellovibrionales bacterium]
MPILIGVTLITFLLFHVVGGDPAFQLAGKNATPEQIESIRSQLGLNKSLALQYLDFVKQTFTLDWGRSWTTQQNISSMISQGIGPSLSLTVPSFILSFLICIGIALFSTYKKGTWIDRSITMVCLALMSVSFLVYIIFYQYLLAFEWGLFPITGWDPSWSGRWSYLILPWIISISVSLGPGILIYRTALLDEVLQDYVRTARAKGVTNWVVYSQHILKNAMIPIITIVVMQMPFLITGSLLLEAFFSIPGLGGILIQAINNSDFPVIKAMTVLGSILYMLFNLLSDLLYAVVDPRVELK